jgi:hypothetical protein
MQTSAQTKKEHRQKKQETGRLQFGRQGTGTGFQAGLKNILPVGGFHRF